MDASAIKGARGKALRDVRIVKPNWIIAAGGVFIVALCFAFALVDGANIAIASAEAAAR